MTNMSRRRSSPSSFPLLSTSLSTQWCEWQLSKCWSTLPKLMLLSGNNLLLAPGLKFPRKFTPLSTRRSRIWLNSTPFSDLPTSTWSETPTLSFPSPRTLTMVSSSPATFSALDTLVTSTVDTSNSWLIMVPETPSFLARCTTETTFNLEPVHSEPTQSSSHSKPALLAKSPRLVVVDQWFPHVCMNLWLLMSMDFVMSIAGCRRSTRQQQQLWGVWREEPRHPRAQEPSWNWETWDGWNCSWLNVPQHPQWSSTHCRNQCQGLAEAMEISSHLCFGFPPTWSWYQLPKGCSTRPPHHGNAHHLWCSIVVQTTPARHAVRRW